VRELEFLPEDYLRARYRRRIGFIRSWLLLAVGLAMVLYSFQMGTWVRDARAELRALQGTGSAVEADVRKVRCLREEARMYNERIALAEALRPRASVTAVLADLVAALPGAVRLERLQVRWPARGADHPPVVRMEGLAPGEQEVTRTLAGLDASPRFGQTILVESRLGEGPAASGRTFALEARLLSLETKQGE